MKYAHYWGKSAKENRHLDSLCLYQAVSAFGIVGIAYICVPKISVNSESDQVIQISGYLCERTTEWFYSDLVSLLRAQKSWNKIKHSLLRMLSESEYEIRKEMSLKQQEDSDFVLLLWSKRRYMILLRGECEILCKKHYWSSIKCIKQENATKIKNVKGFLHEQNKFLLVSAPCSNCLSKYEIASVFRNKIDENGKMEKILMECNERIRNQKKEQEKSMIWIHICEEDL